jgi:aerobic carbon-monoxide dehydrogenase small subunit
MPDSREPDAHARAHKIRVQCEINGRAMTLETYSMARLLDVLREQLGLTGTKEGCGEGECGACAVELDGALVNSCLVPAMQADGAKIRTIEGVADSDSLLQDNPLHNDPLLNERLHAVQQAFLAHGGAQCGICTPGMILAAVNLLDRNPHPSEAEIREGLAGNLCRCTGYTKIFESVVAAFRSSHSHAEPRH